LIGAFGQAIKEKAEEFPNLITVEKHGRDDKHNYRSIGWFTEYLTIELTNNIDYKYINEIKEQIEGESKKTDGKYCINFLGRTSNFSIENFDPIWFFNTIGCEKDFRISLFDLEFIVWLDDKDQLKYKIYYSNQFSQEWIRQFEVELQKKFELITKLALTPDNDSIDEYNVDLNKLIIEINRNAD